MKLWWMTVVLMAFLAAGADDQPGGLAEKVRKASFVFQGTVSQPGASNVKSIEKSETTVLVKIDQVLKSPKVLKGLAGHEVTVILGQAGGAAALKAGQKAVFFTEGAVYGEKLAVREVAPRRWKAPQPRRRPRRPSRPATRRTRRSMSWRRPPNRPTMPSRSTWPAPMRSSSGRSPPSSRSTRNG